MVTDPISDMLVQLKNAAMVGKPSVIVPLSNVKMEIAKVLLENGYLSDVSKRGKKNRKFLQCDLAYVGGKSRLTEVKRMSKPSRRIYQGVADIRSVRQGMGLAVLSTPKGILADKQAKEQNVGGELLFMIW
ncbi:MAG TPA: 30S ribosomal protein S8 [Candidatus Paceibacterota bacterium]|nr:30S ribosomal protein S8 [Candidatus Paceibacterota bacterium]